MIQIAQIRNALNNPDPGVRNRVFESGKLTGWRRYADGSYGAPNFERALVLDLILRTRKPRAILEIGTGRGLGSITMAQAARDLGLATTIATVDFLGPDTQMDWPARQGEQDSVLRMSRSEMWKSFPEASAIEQITGPTERVLPRLKLEGRRYDFIFVDAGHDVFSVVHDLAYAAAMLDEGGVILMDDFAPEEEYGMGTCMLTTHYRRMFESVHVFATEGRVYGNAENPDYPRGMVLLQGLKSGSWKIRRTSLLFWRIFNKLFKTAYFSRRLFPFH